MAKDGYWNHVQEDLVYQWGIANQAQQFKIYDKLFKSVRHMAASILGRYFMYSPDNREIQQDAINHLFCNMHKFDPEKGYTAFSYCQTILKNYYHTIAKNKKGKVFAIKLEYYDDLDSPEFNYSYEFEPYEEEHRFEPVFNRLEQARYKLMCYLIDHKKVPPTVKKRINNEIEFLNNTTEFLYKHRDSQGLTPLCISENAMKSLGLCEGTIAGYTKKHLGFMSYSNTVDKYESKMDSKYDLHYMEDDWTPDVTVMEKKKKRMKRQENNKHIHIEYNDNHE